jgi:aspartate dehydrogenase
MSEGLTRDLTVGIAGLGAVGLPVARALDAGQIPGVRLTAISVRNVDRARDLTAGFNSPPEIVPLGELAGKADAIIESLPAAAFDEIADAAIDAGKIFLPLSVGQLLRRNELIVRAAETGARIIVPTGALLGLDAVRAAAEGEIRSVTMVTRKPPGGLAGAPHVVANGIDLDAVREPTRIFEGSARDAAIGFPANINVAVALSLAGIGPDHTRVEIWADPTVDRNTHTVKVDGDAARFEMTIENVPSEENPRTGKLTALSTLAALRSLVATLRVGT